MAVTIRIDQMVLAACTAKRDDRDVDSISDRARELNIIAFHRPIPFDRLDNYLAGSVLRHPLRKFHGLELCRLRTRADPGPGALKKLSLDVDTNHDRR